MLQSHEWFAVTYVKKKMISSLLPLPVCPSFWVSNTIDDGLRLNNRPYGSSEYKAGSSFFDVRHCSSRIISNVLSSFLRLFMMLFSGSNKSGRLRILANSMYRSAPNDHRSTSYTPFFLISTKIRFKWISPDLSFWNTIDSGLLEIILESLTLVSVSTHFSEQSLIEPHSCHISIRSRFQGHIANPAPIIGQYIHLELGIFDFEPLLW